MAEDRLLNQLKSLREAGRIDDAIHLLIEHTSRDKTIDPSDTGKLEKMWAFVANPLMSERKLQDYLRVYNSMKDTLQALQTQDDTRYHKGLPYYSIGNGLIAQAFQFFLYSFVEDSINQGRFPDGLPSVSTLQGVFKVDSEFLQDRARANSQCIR